MGRRWNWKGGRSVASNGYVLVRVGKEHHLADVRGYAYEHRVIAEQKTGRRLQSGEQVHHIDGNKQNNAPENLEVCADSHAHHAEHRKRDNGLRNPGEPNPVVGCACGCGQSFHKFDRSNRPRDYISGHNRMPSPTIDAVLRAVQDGPLRRADIARRVSISTQAIASCLSKLKRCGAVRNVAPGIWALAGDSDG